MSMTILIVEDRKDMQGLLAGIVEPIREKFPRSRVVIVDALDDALDLVRKASPPDLIVLDLVIIGSNMERTIRHLKEIEERAPVVIVTGHPIEEVLERVKVVGLTVPVVSKADEHFDDKLLSALVKAFLLWRGKQVDALSASINTMKEMLTNGST